MLDLLKAALRGGFKTSEFWLAVAALFVPLVDGAVQHVVDYLNNAGATTHNPVYLVILTGAAAFISGAYSIARALVKKEQVKQLPTAVALENAKSTIADGSPDAERLHAINAGASPSDVSPTVPPPISGYR